MVMTGLTRGSACVVLLLTGDKMEKIIFKKYFTSKQTQLSKH